MTTTHSRGGRSECCPEVDPAVRCGPHAENFSRLVRKSNEPALTGFERFAVRSGSQAGGAGQNSAAPLPFTGAVIAPASPQVFKLHKGAGHD